MSLEKYETIIAALVLKVKEGGNEGENAKRALQKLCTKYQLDIDDILNETEKKEDRWYPITNVTKVIVAQIIRRYGGTTDIYNTRGKQHFVAEETTAEHLEICNAIDVLVPLYKKERKKALSLIEEAFVYKHDLFWKGPRPKQIGEEPELTVDERVERMQRAAAISGLTRTMEDAVIQKRLK